MLSHYLYRYATVALPAYISNDILSSVKRKVDLSSYFPIQSIQTIPKIIQTWEDRKQVQGIPLGERNVETPLTSL